MVAVKGLSTFKSRVSAEREARKSGGVSFKVYTEIEKVKICSGDHVAADTKRKSMPVKAETSQIQANCSKVALNELDKIHGKNITSTTTKVGRKVLGDISNSQSYIKKNETSDGSKSGKVKMEKMAYSQRASVLGTKSRNASSSLVGTKNLEVFNGISRTRLQSKETVGNVPRESTRNYRPPQRKSLPVLKHADKGDTCDIKKGNFASKVKNKDTFGFSVKSKVGVTVVPQASNGPHHRMKNRVSDGSIKTGSGDRSTGKVKLEKMAYSQRASIVTKSRNASSSSGKLSMGTHVGSQCEAVSGRVTLGRVGTKDLKVFNGNPRTRLQSYVTRESTRIYRPPQRKSLPVLKHADKADTCDIKKGNLAIKVKNKEKFRFSVKPKVSTTVVPQVSNVPHLRLKSRVSDGSIKTGSGGQSTGNTKILSRRSTKPTVKLTIGIPKASRRTSVFSKPTSEKKEETSAAASTSNPTAIGKPRRRKSYTSSLIEGSKMLKDLGSVTKEEILPEIYDDRNQLEVSEYVDEIYQHYWVTEAHHQSLKNYMEIQTDITPQMRGILINWLIEVHLKFDLMQETLYLMVTLLDYYLSVVTIKKNEMQLVGLTALLIASKYEDFWHPKVMELISISAELYTREQMLTMETTILHKLNFRLNLPTPYVFMLRFLRAAKGTKEFENLAYFLIELCLVEYDALHFKPSMLCASAIYVARCTLHLSPPWTPLLSKHSRYEEFQIRDCAEMILRFHQRAKTAMLKVTYDKYTSKHNYKVASIRPLNRLPSP